MENNSYRRTDLAAEAPVFERTQDMQGISTNKETKNGFNILTVNVIDETGAKKIGKPIGTYVTIELGKVWLMEQADLNSAIQVLANVIRGLSLPILNGRSPAKIMIVGLGNRYITSDSIGPLTAKNITATDHLHSKNTELFELLGKHRLSVIAPGVTGQTGVDTAELVAGAVSYVSPDLIVAVDALAARSADRLATTVQVCNTGISPGSGIGNHVKAINKDTLGVPVIAVGLPTMVSSSTLVYDALEKAGIESINDDLSRVLETGMSFFVTLNETDTVISSLASLIAQALETAFSI